MLALTSRPDLPISDTPYNGRVVHSNNIIINNKMDIQIRTTNMDEQSSYENLITQNESIAEHTTFKCGGTADYTATPTSLQELRETLEFVRQRQLPLTILGGGSNVLVSDRGIRGMVLFTRKLTSCHVRGELLCSRCGLSLDKAINFAIENGLAGMERLGGIPGTVGGAIAGNAGVPGLQISQSLEYIDYLTLDGNLHRMEATTDLFSYRHSPFSDRDDLVIFEAGFRLAPTNQTAEARLRKEQAKTKRRQTGQYDYPSAGSMFKNPKEGLFAGKLIEERGLKGRRYGGAQISVAHANFFLNPEHKATSLDIWRLAEIARRTVLEATGIDLQREIKLIGDWREEDFQPS